MAVEDDPESNKKQTIEKLRRHFEDRTASIELAFTQKGRNVLGKSEGYVAARKSDNAFFMIKNALKTEEHVDENGNRSIRSDKFDSINFVNEFITAPLYRRMLYDRAPIIAGVESNNPNIVSLRSRFLDKFETVSHFTEGNPTDNNIGFKAYKLKDVQGSEKLFAAMLFAGEYDMHANNIGVMDVKDEEGKDIKVFSKIDHGWSASQIFSDREIMMENFSKAYDRCGYSGNINLNIVKFKEAIDEILEISDQEIETIIKSRTQELKTMGFDAKGLIVPFWRDDKLHDIELNPPLEARIDGFEALEKLYIRNYKLQRESMQHVSKALGKIAKLEHSSSNWKDGQWLSDIDWSDLKRSYESIKKNAVVRKPQEQGITLLPPPLSEKLGINPLPPTPPIINPAPRINTVATSNVTPSQVSEVVQDNKKILIQKDKSDRKGIFKAIVDSKFLFATRVFARNARSKEASFDQAKKEDLSVSSNKKAKIKNPFVR